MIITFIFPSKEEPTASTTKSKQNLKVQIFGKLEENFFRFYSALPLAK
jgi:hypothetical protein